MQEIKKIGVVSLGKILALFGAFIGFFQGLVMSYVAYQYSIMGLSVTLSEAVEIMAQDPTVGVIPLFVAVGWWAIIIAPLLTAAVYFVAGLLLALIYNMVAKDFGGIKLEIQEKKTQKKKK